MEARGIFGTPFRTRQMNDGLKTIPEAYFSNDVSDRIFLDGVFLATFRVGFR
jgi:hypothetical protein